MTDPAAPTASARVAGLLRDAIRSGQLKVGDRLPTRREMHERYGIAAMTAARVVRMLVEEGIAVSDVGRGVFVAALPGETTIDTADLAPEELATRVFALEQALPELRQTLAELRQTLAELQDQCGGHDGCRFPTARHESADPGKSGR